MDIVRFHIIVGGLVQTVGFRNFTDITASILGLSGTAENKKDKTGDMVDIYLEGDRKKVEIATHVVSMGPRMSRVDNLSIIEEPVTGEQGFTVIMPTPPPMPKYSFGFNTPLSLPAPAQLPLLPQPSHYNSWWCFVCGTPLFTPHSRYDQMGEEYNVCDDCVGEWMALMEGWYG